MHSYVAEARDNIRFDPLFGITWRRNVSGTSCKLLEKKMFQRIRNIWQVTWRRCYNVAGTSCMLLEEDLTTYQERPGSYLKRRICYNVSGTSCKWLDGDVRTYQERLASYLTKMLRCIRNALQVTSRKCYNVSGTSCKSLDEDVTT